MQPTGLSSLTQAATVAERFTQLYYGVLRTQPGQIGRFYKAASTLTLCEPAASGVTVFGEVAIQEHWKDSAVAFAETNVQNLNAQASQKGGVLLVASGTMTLTGGHQRQFVQVFWLDTQENGFYVFNDILRLFDATAEQSSAAVTSNGDAYIPEAQQQAAAELPYYEPESVTPPQPAEPPLAAHQHTQQPPQPSVPAGSSKPVAPPPQSSPQPPANWAALLKPADARKVQEPAAAIPALAPAPQPGPQPAAQTDQSMSRQDAGALPDQQVMRHSNPQHTVVVKNLPNEHLAQELLQAEFSKFGTLRKVGAVTIHNLGRELGKVAYVKYEDPAAVELAIAGTVVISGKQCEIKRYDPAEVESAYNRAGGRGPYRGGRGGRSGPYPSSTGRGGRGAPGGPLPSHDRPDKLVHGRGDARPMSGAVNGRFGGRGSGGRGRGVPTHSTQHDGPAPAAAP